MTHDEFLNLLSARLDGELPAEDQERLDAYLRENADARVLLEAFESQDAEMRRAFEPRRDAAAAVARRAADAAARSQVAGAPPSFHRARLREWASLSALAAAVLAAVLWLSWRSQQRPSSVEMAGVANLAGDAGLKPRPLLVPPEPQHLAAGQSLRTGPGERRRARLPDGSVVYLNQNTAVAVADARRLKLEAGEIFTEVVPADGGVGRFVVETPRRTVTALGTKFAVRADQAGTGVLVTQGKVQVSGLDRPVAAGQELSADAGTPAPAPRASHMLDWAQELIASAGSPLVPAGGYSGGALVAVDPYGQEARLALVKYHVDVHVEDGFARTTIDQTYFNAENFDMEGTFYFPLPPDASLSRLAMYVDGNLMEGGMAERDHARQTYERIRYAQRDPALLEWVDGSLFKMRVFPLEARREKRLLLSYTQRLPSLYGRTTYRFPAGHSLQATGEWSFSGLVKGGGGVQFHSPSHPAMAAERRGRDLVLRATARGAALNKDVVVELTDPTDTGAGEQCRWSAGELDGSRYLLLRYRPDLPNRPARERRDWVVLFESSGGRDPLLARAQIELLRSLLANAEHDDTFSVLTVGTRVRRFRPEALPATAENVAEAVAFLEQAHLVGALNLEDGLREAARSLQGSPNPYLVHLGGGSASLGESRTEALIGLIPAGARYVGVAVGKRFTLQFMKGAAERTGGYFTQVNPDEPINWRGFDLAATLNTPRLLDVSLSVAGPAGNDVTGRFLHFGNLISQGEEFAAVARLEADPANDPQAVTLRGTLDGQPFERTLPVRDVAEGAGYLPRTWAKLELERLVAEDAAKHRKAIVELSKAMYVMTPFTSLLVLENEQMYRQFRVDRGRKDHWAMYPAPERIEVKYIPDPNRPAGPPGPGGRKPHANEVMQTILLRNPPAFLTSPNGSRNEPVQTAGQRYGSGLGLPLTGAGAVPRRDERGVSNGGMGLDVADFDWDGFSSGEGKPADSTLFFSSPDGRRPLGRDHRLAPDGSQFSLGDGFDNVWLWTGPTGSVDGRSVASGASENYSVPGLEAFPMSWPGHSSGIDSVRRDPVRLREVRIRRRQTGGQPTYERFYSTLGRTNWSLNGEVFWGEAAFGDPNRRSSTSKQIIAVRGLIDTSGSVSSDHPTDGILAEGQTGSFTAIEVTGPLSRARAILAGQVRGPAYYTRPSFTGDERVFTNLVAYAPAMNSALADVQAVLEAEAAPHAGTRPGSIDPAARRLVEGARTAAWSRTVVHLSGDESVAVVHDGRGRYAYERRLHLGLLERVVCDGSTLLHLYPEIGIGARRPVSRFHRADFAALCPDVLPPVEDLAVGADVRVVDDRTVAIVPFPPANDAQGSSHHVEEQLVFEGGRLAERRWVRARDKSHETLWRERYEPSGTWRQLDAGGKERSVSSRDRQPAPAPDLRPDLSKLVVLTLPFRTRSVAYTAVGMEPDGTLADGVNGCIPYLDEESALQLFTAEYAENRVTQAAEIWQQCFAARGDRRVGFYTLLASCGAWVTGYEAFQRQFAENPTDPLLGYLALLHNGSFTREQARFGLLPGRQVPETFLGRLSTFRSLALRWRGEFAADTWFGYRPAEIARALAFVRQNADNPLGWCALTFLQDRVGDDRVLSRQVAEAWGRVAERSPLPYPARYEQARSLADAGHPVAARERFESLFLDSLKQGVLPPLDAAFRSALAHEASPGSWPRFMRAIAEQCAARKGQRPVVVAIAWQCRQIGDQALAESLLDLALSGFADDEDRVETTLAAIEYVWQAGETDEADRLLQGLFALEKPARSPIFWRLASHVADRRGHEVESIEYLEKALDLEFSDLPAVVNLDSVRANYGRLLEHYQWLTGAAQALRVAPSADLLSRTVRAADRWRALDPESSGVCERAAAILRQAGGSQGAELAWDYLTTPLALRPNDPAPWLSLASTLSREGQNELADRCFDAAFRAEPTNAQILWDRAQQLQRTGRVSRAREQLERLAAGDWQPRFAWLQAQARQMLGK